MEAQTGRPGLVARWRDIWARFSGRGAYPHQLAGLLLIPLRRIILSPRDVVGHLQLAATDRVLEVGPGPGFFSVDVARALPAGRLELVDLQREMLGRARRRLARAGVRRVGFTQADAGALPFRDATFDAAFLVAVLGEVPDARGCIASVARLLRPGGRLLIAELPGDPDALQVGDLERLAEGTGLVMASSARVSRATLTTFRRA